MAQIPHPDEQIGRFVIQQQLGQGGMGTVFLAKDTLLDTLVALKFLKTSLEDTDAFTRFSREVLMARRVSHPGICRIFDIHEEQGHRFISMEYIEGPTLYHVIHSDGPLPPVQAAGLVRALCSAVAAAHAHEIIHRDLKPSNVIVRASDRISILDFGLSKAQDLETITQHGVQVGSLHYISPERGKGMPASPQCDIYSLGVILYEGLTGRLPYQGTSLLDILRAIDRGKPVPPSQFASAVTSDLDQLVLTAIDPDPGRRYRQVDQLSAALGAYLGKHGKWSKDLDSSTSGPWHGNIAESVQAALTDPQVSEVIRSHMRDTSILFSDIVAITPYFDSHGDVAGMKKIQRHNDLLFPVIQAHQGRVIKTIGDAIMACFEEAEQGVRAAIDMQHALAAYNAEQVEKDHEIHIRIGLHSGASIFENDDVFGDTVNTAARISSRTEGDKILISHSTRHMLDGSKNLAHYHSTVELKGKSGEYELYQVDWEARGPETLETAIPWNQPSGDPPTFSGQDAGTLVEAPPTTVQELRTADLDAPTIFDARMMVADLELKTDHDTDQEPPTMVGDTELPRIDTIADRTAGLPGATTAAAARTSFTTRRLLFGAVGLAVLGLGIALLMNTGDASSPAASAGPEPVPVRTTADTDAGSTPISPPVLDPAPVEPEPEPTVAPDPEPSPALEPHRSETTRHSIERQLRDLGRARGSKGIIGGDDRELDHLLQKASTLRRQKRWQECQETLRQARRIVDELKINKSFVSAKLNRFNTRYDRNPAAQSDSQLNKLALDVMAAMDKGLYERANDLLNQALRKLR